VTDQRSLPRSGSISEYPEVPNDRIHRFDEIDVTGLSSLTREAIPGPANRATIRSGIRLEEPSLYNWMIVREHPTGGFFLRGAPVAGEFRQDRRASRFITFTGVVYLDWDTVAGRSTLEHYFPEKPSHLRVTIWFMSLSASPINAGHFQFDGEACTIFFGPEESNSYEWQYMWTSGPTEDLTARWTSQMDWVSVIQPDQTIVMGVLGYQSRRDEYFKTKMSTQEIHQRAVALLTSELNEEQLKTFKYKKYREDGYKNYPYFDHHIDDEHFFRIFAKHASNVIEFIREGPVWNWCLTPREMNVPVEDLMWTIKKMIEWDLAEFKRVANGSPRRPLAQELGFVGVDWGAREDATIACSSGGSEVLQNMQFDFREEDLHIELVGDVPSARESADAIRRVRHQLAREFTSRMDEFSISMQTTGEAFEELARVFEEDARLVDLEFEFGDQRWIARGASIQNNRITAVSEYGHEVNLDFRMENGNMILSIPNFLSGLGSGNPLIELYVSAVIWFRNNKDKLDKIWQKTKGKFSKKKL